MSLGSEVRSNNTDSLDLYTLPAVCLAFCSSRGAFPWAVCFSTATKCPGPEMDWNFLTVSLILEFHEMLLLLLFCG